MSRLSRGEYAYAAGSVAALIEDEQRHDVQLSQAATGLPLVSTDFGARHFFRRLEAREPGVHLARIAALDACSCQLLSRMLAPTTRSLLPPGLADTLAAIRRDEGLHVRVKELPQKEVADRMIPAATDDPEMLMRTAPFGRGIYEWIGKSAGFNLMNVKTPVRLEAHGPTMLVFDWDGLAACRG
jgi:hypothetical protein